MWELCCAYALAVAEHWPIWLVTIVLIVAAVIDGFELKVPNWITFPFILSGWVFSVAAFGWEGLGWSLLGTGVGLGLLMPALCHRRHGRRRREAAGRRRRLGLWSSHDVRLCLRRRSSVRSWPC